jgi:hypothetical protein
MQTEGFGHHPLEFIPNQYRTRIFLTVLFLTLVLFGFFSVLDTPLQTAAAPNGIVSFEFARTAGRANAITSKWKRSHLFLSAVAGQADSDIVNIPYAFASFGLGLDYLFMPVYSFALAFGTLLAARWQVTGHLLLLFLKRWKTMPCSRSH